MKVRLIAYGVAKDILKAKAMDWPIQETYTIATLKQELIRDYPAFASLTKLSFAVEEEYRDDSFALHDGVDVVIIPPVSGG